MLFLDSSLELKQQGNKSEEYLLHSGKLQGELFFAEVLHTVYSRLIINLFPVLDFKSYPHVWARTRCSKPLPCCSPSIRENHWLRTQWSISPAPATSDTKPTVRRISTE
jgi:hypothetical protein